jgi:hypothetical protein
VAAQNPADREPTAAPGTVAPDGFVRVVGATRREAAMLAEKGAERQLIHAYQKKEDFFHRASYPAVTNRRAKKLAERPNFGYNTASCLAALSAEYSN